jgi:hypothetical protein
MCLRAFGAHDKFQMDAFKKDRPACLIDPARRSLQWSKKLQVAGFSPDM